MKYVVYQTYSTSVTAISTLACKMFWQFSCGHDQLKSITQMKDNNFLMNSTCFKYLMITDVTANCLVEKQKYQVNKLCT